MDESPSPASISREDLYKKVWSTPILKLAAEFGMSNVGLAKVCKKHKIPRPSLGYWAKLQNGKEVLRWPLQPIKDQSLAIVHFGQRPKVKRLPAVEPAKPQAKPIEIKLANDPEIAALIAQELLPENQIECVTDSRSTDAAKLPEYISLAEASRMLPKIDGKKISIATITRWIVHGAGCAQLQGRKISNRWFTTVDWLEDFFKDRTNAALPNRMTSPAAACRDCERAQRELETRYGFPPLPLGMDWYTAKSVGKEKEWHEENARIEAERAKNRGRKRRGAEGGH